MRNQLEILENLDTSARFEGPGRNIPTFRITGGAEERKVSRWVLRGKKEGMLIPRAGKVCPSTLMFEVRRPLRCGGSTLWDVEGPERRSCANHILGEKPAGEPPSKGPANQRVSILKKKVRMPESPKEGTPNQCSPVLKKFTGVALVQRPR